VASFEALPGSFISTTSATIQVETPPVIIDLTPGMSLALGDALLLEVTVAFQPTAANSYE